MAHIATAVMVLLASAHGHVIDQMTWDSRKRNLTEATNNESPTAGLQLAEWGVWSSWFCSVPCRAAGFFVRTRNCDQPGESSVGCDGAAIQQSGTCNTSQIQCPFECMSDFWGVGCGHRCPFTCRNQQCLPTSGLCSSCPDYFFGDGCQIRCHTGRFGEKCEHTCHRLCFMGCNLQNGSCPWAIAIYVVAVMAMTIASFLPTILAYHKYLRTHDSTS